MKQERRSVGRPKLANKNLKKESITMIVICTFLVMLLITNGIINFNINHKNIRASVVKENIMSKSEFMSLYGVKIDKMNSYIAGKYEGKNECAIDTAFKFGSKVKKYIFNFGDYIDVRNDNIPTWNTTFQTKNSVYTVYAYSSSNKLLSTTKYEVMIDGKCNTSVKRISFSINKKGWVKIISGSDTNWYYFNDDGYMVSGWQRITSKGNTNWYYFNSDGVMHTGWKKLNYNNKTSWYYFNSKGAMQTGWQKIKSNGKENWYYLVEKTDKSKNIYLGEMLTYLQKINGKYYYFNGSGKMQTGWVKFKDHSIRYFNKKGIMLTYLQKINGKYYYFNGSGKMQKGLIKFKDGKIRYFDKNGVMIINKCVNVINKEYCFDKNGIYNEKKTATTKTTQDLNELEVEE